MSEREISESVRETLAVFHGEELGVPLTTSEVATHFELSHQSANERLHRLAETDCLRTKKVGEGRIWWCPTTEDNSLPASAISVSTDEGVDADDGFSSGNDLFETPTGHGPDDGSQVQARHREEPAAIAALSEVVRDIGDAIIEQSTRAEIEAVVCDQLVASDCYDFAWFGRVDSPKQSVTLTAEAGVENYLEDTTITVAQDETRGDGPTGRAFRSGEIQIWRAGDSDSQYEPGLAQAEAYGFNASAAIPITYQGVSYGVLHVDTERATAFTGRERDILNQLGASIGHAIAAVERKRALMTNDIVELRFHVPDFMSDLDLESVDGRISIAETVPRGDDQYVVYGTATGDAADWLDGIVERIDHWDSVEYRDNGTEEPDVFELHLDQEPVVSTVASVGGAVVEATIENGQYSLTVQVPPGAGVRKVIDAVQDAYPQAEMLSRTQTTRDTSITSERGLDIADELTDRQLAVLRAAYQAGFFQWPRDASGEDVAESLDIAAPTFQQHLRKAEKAIFAVFLSTVSS